MVVEVNVQHVFKYPVEFVARTHYNKYPNQTEKFVLSVKTLEQRYDNHTGSEFKRRVATCHNVIPQLLRNQLKVLDEPNIVMEEMSWFNRRERTLLLKGRNLTWPHFVDMSEQSLFTVHEENASWTVLEQRGTVDLQRLGVLGRVVEMFAKGFLTSAAHRGIGIVEELLAERAKMETQSHQRHQAETTGDPRVQHGA